MNKTKYYKCTSVILSDIKYLFCKVKNHKIVDGFFFNQNMKLRNEKPTKCMFFRKNSLWDDVEISKEEYFVNIL